MSGVRVVETAAIGSDFLDGFLAGDRASGDGLLATGERVDNLVVQMEVLDRATGDQHNSAEHRDR